MGVMILFPTAAQSGDTREAAGSSRQPK